MEEPSITPTDFLELKTEVSGLRNDLKRFIEHSNQQHTSAILDDLKTTYSEVFSDHQIATAQSTLSAHMAGKCAMREQCFAAFMEFLQQTARHIRDGEVSDEVIRSYRHQIETMRKNGGGKECSTCFSEVTRLFEKQVDLMQSLGIYQANGDGPGEGDEIPGDVIVKDILEPAASLPRFRILEYLSVQTRSFSDISQMTGLRGGNLLFHIKKLTDSGMVLQQHERGDYVITAKGYKVLAAITDLYRDLHPTPPGDRGRP